jgi:hypothetical protein
MEINSILMFCLQLTVTCVRNVLILTLWPARVTRCSVITATKIVVHDVSQVGDLMRHSLLTVHASSNETAEVVEPSFTWKIRKWSEAYVTSICARPLTVTSYHLMVSYIEFFRTQSWKYCCSPFWVSRSRCKCYNTSTFRTTSAILTFNWMTLHKSDGIVKSSKSTYLLTKLSRTSDRIWPSSCQSHNMNNFAEIVWL